jgi:hypothetical protein
MCQLLKKLTTSMSLIITRRVAPAAPNLDPLLTEQLQARPTTVQVQNLIANAVSSIPGSDESLTEALLIRPTTTQVQNLITQAAFEAGIGTTLTPFTPAALAGSLPLWLDAGDSTTLTISGGSVSNWRNKGDAGGSFVPVLSAPLFQDNEVVFNATPLSSDVAFPTSLNFIVLAVTRQSDYSTEAHVLNVAGYITTLGVKNGTVYGFTQPDFQNQVSQAVGPGTTLRGTVFSREERLSRTRIGQNGAPGALITATAVTLAQGPALLGGERQSNNSVENPFKGNIVELVYCTTSSMALIRKLEGYYRLKYGIALPPTHPYATTPPYVENLSPPDLTPQVV